MVKFTFPSLISKITLEKETEVLAGTLGEALEKLVEKYGKNFNDIVFEESGEVNRYLNFFVKGRESFTRGDMNVALNENDEVIVLIVISGG